MADRFDDATGQLPGLYPNPVTAIHAWLDPLIEHEIRRTQEEDDELIERMRRASLSPSGSSPSTPRAQRTGGRGAQPTPVSPPPKGGALALLNEKASRQKPAMALIWYESDEGDAHEKIFTAELEGECRYGSPTSSEDSLYWSYRVVGGSIIAKGVEKSKKAAKQLAASKAIDILGWVSMLIISIIPDLWT